MAFEQNFPAFCVLEFVNVVRCGNRGNLARAVSTEERGRQFPAASKNRIGLTEPIWADEQKLREISLEYKEAELVSATSNFDPSRRLGSGNYGCVYRGTLKDGHEVAIKVIEVDEEDTSGFADEVLVLSKFRHPNLVTLMGWGSGLDEDGCGRRYLVYELLEGGDVAGRLAKARAGGAQSTRPWPKA
ncbi:LEAF RUST 10 DISEASE-RESISTANCE LOCUS RECEPTOR-LIKE PROTEIN KINASE-like 1.2 (Probable receptor-like serine/threonine-protein kinase LRK10L-1.2) [Durusdinium trenchii]|uniref:LEAF RUST 10 DISEASE-RESISTANCE LOCUS RECEPTOR-LIKE PROTEIN KINASE-like 1.2 (Probable receptor-like serine/threonine-protein kinase LRK10L-1.2) n=1 Tax=Durusdinium trenchii TaxID=1381693 RepID=A0ABP0IAA6_9DINO